MCYSYAIHHQSQALPFNSQGLQIPSPGFYFNGFNKPHLPICSTNKNWELAQWGLIPHWSKNPEDQQSWFSKTLNARSETASDKPAFKNAWSKNPCVVLSTGFFEWQHRGNEKIPYFIYPKSQEYLWFAGLFEDAVVEGTFTRTFTILTTEAKGIMSEIHHSKQRMPVMLHTQELEYWLDGSDQERKLLCQTRNTEFLIAHKINPNILKNNRLNNSPSVIQAFENLQSQWDF
jgi:putative SOS response-associated peptidase YedK